MRKRLRIIHIVLPNYIPIIGKISSITNTTEQQDTATHSRFAPSQAATMPIISANTPEIGLCVASMIAGKVMIASVTYGT